MRKTSPSHERRKSTERRGHDYTETQDEARSKKPRKDASQRTKKKEHDQKKTPQQDQSSRSHEETLSRNGRMHFRLEAKTKLREWARLLVETWAFWQPIADQWKELKNSIDPQTLPNFTEDNIQALEKAQFSETTQ